MSLPPHGHIDITKPPCPYCVWTEPHRHWLREDGSLGLLVEPIAIIQPLSSDGLVYHPETTDEETSATD